MMGHPLLQETAIPFSLLLTEHGGELECLAPLRIRPGKRLTCLASRESKLVVAKIFHATPSGLRHWKEDLAGLQALHEAGILAPRIKLWDSDPSLDLAFIITEFLNDAETFLDAWQAEADIGKREAMLCQLLRILARQHQAGLLHQDPHLRNFMLDRGQVVTIDGGDIRVCREGLSQQQSIDNLGLLLAQFPSTEAENFGSCIGSYLAGRNWPEDADHLGRIQLATRTARGRRWQKYSRKVFRECSAFVVQRSNRHRTICRRGQYEGEIRDFLSAPEDFIQSDRTTCLKDGNSSSVYSLELDGAQRVIKRYNIKTAGHALRRALQPTRAAHSWRNGLGLEFHGISTAPVVAFQENRFGPLRSGAYLLMDQLSGPTLRTCIETTETPDPEVLEQVCSLVLQLQHMHISHGDLKASNFIISDKRVAIIDLDSMRFFRSDKTFQSAGRADLLRFLQNWDEQPTVQEFFSRRFAP